MLTEILFEVSVSVMDTSLSSDHLAFSNTLTFSSVVLSTQVSMVDYS